MKTSFASKTIAAAALATLSLTASAAGLSYNIGVVSLYKSRGVDQDFKDKDFRPAIQGGVDYDFGNGFYLGNWNSTGKFGDANLEIDLYGGYKGEITKDVGYDVGYIHYIYPSEGGFNSGEIYGGLSYGPVSAKMYYGTRDGVNKGMVYTTVGYSLPLTDALALKASLGVRNKKAGDFADYSLGVAYDLGSSLSVSATLAGATKRSAATDGERDNRLILGVTKGF